MTGVTTREIACALAVSSRSVIMRADREHWPYRKEGQRRVWDTSALPQDVQARLARAPILEPSENLPAPPTGGEAVLFKRATETSREKALLRAALLSTYHSSGHRLPDFLDSYNQGQAAPAILSRLGRVSAATFYRWLAASREDGIEGVVPRWGLSGRGSSLSAIERGYLEHWYLSQERRSISHCWNLMRRAIPDSTASYSAARRYLTSLPKPYVDRERLGPSKFESMYQPYVDRDPELLGPMEQVVSDHHNFDFVVVKDGKRIRPWITCFQDYRSGKILGWCPSVYPSGLSIAVSLYRMVSVYGSGVLIHIDNGKDYRGKAMRGQKVRAKVVNEDGTEDDIEIYIMGAFELLGSQVTYAKPYHGQSKGRMERTFGIFAEYFAKDSGSYVGSNTVTKPEDANLIYRAINKRARRDDLPTWEEFVEALEQFIPYFNASWRGKGKGMHGRTADEVFASEPSRGHPVDAEALLLALTKAQVRRVRENGVRVGGVDYYAPELFEFSGRDVIVRLPIANPEVVIVQDPKGRTLCTARAAVFADTGDITKNNQIVGAARKANLEALARFGVGRLAPPDDSRSIPRLAVPERPRIAPPAPDSLPIAAGAEHLSPPKSRYKSPLDL